MQRREFIQAALLTGFVTSVRNSVGAEQHGRPPRILLRSSWQAVNIGDIAHTPGVLALIEKHIPDAEVRLWAGGLPKHVAAMILKRFPKLQIVKGSIGSDGAAKNSELGEAIEWSDFFLHGSGPFLVGRRDLSAWVKHVGKPHGIYGITYGAYDQPEDAELISNAKFAYFRDSVSLEAAKKDGINCPVMQFGPDGAFACDLRNDAKAAAFTRANKLEVGKFACCIPRWRLTPGWKMHNREPDDRDKQRTVRNMEMVEHDHALLRDTIARIVRETDLKVLVCPEDMTQMELGKTWIVDKLPDDVKRRVVWRQDFWLTDEALSTYVRSAGLFGLEMHSPIMCIGNGIPAAVGRFAEQSSKGIMWRDIGLNEWLFDVDNETDINRMPETVLSMLQDTNAAKAAVTKAQGIVHQRQHETMKEFGSHLLGTQPRSSTLGAQVYPSAALMTEVGNGS